MAHLIGNPIEKETTPSHSDGQPVVPTQPPGKVRWTSRLRDWIEERTGVFTSIKHHLDEPMPPEVDGGKRWATSC
ncbi:MAG: hypothetical protein ACUVTY_12665 [Armatimonadota bacterium]